jgi:hypothetical protein
MLNKYILKNSKPILSFKMQKMGGGNSCDGVFLPTARMQNYAKQFARVIISATSTVNHTIPDSDWIHKIS